MVSLEVRSYWSQNAAAVAIAEARSIMVGVAPSLAPFTSIREAATTRLAAKGRYMAPMYIEGLTGEFLSARRHRLYKGLGVDVHVCLKGIDAEAS